jgi:hypothetical protein
LTDPTSSWSSPVAGREHLNAISSMTAPGLCWEDLCGASIHVDEQPAAVAAAVHIANQALAIGI